MEGMTSSLMTMWVIYIISAAVGFWCFRRIPFWIKKRGIGHWLFSGIGFAIVFTPVPISDESFALAPAFVVAAFTYLSDGFEGIAYMLPWFLATYGVGVVWCSGLVGIRWIIGKRMAHNESEAAVSETSVNEKDSTDMMARNPRAAGRQDPTF